MNPESSKENEPTVSSEMVTDEPIYVIGSFRDPNQEPFYENYQQHEELLSTFGYSESATC